MCSDRVKPDRLIWAFVVLGLAVRIGYWVDLRQHTDHGFPSFYSVFNAPISDALGWIQFGDTVRLGKGDDHAWTARRPLYGFFLGTLYCWVDPRLQFTVAQAMNVVMSGLTVGLIYAAYLPLVGRAVAMAAALWFCFDVTSLCFSIVTLSETMGAFFTAWHLAFLARAQNGRWFDLAGAGLAIAAANLARTLSLFALPLACLLLVVVRWRKSGSMVRGIWDASIFGAFAALLILIAMGRNYYVAGIFTVSDNTASILYAATSPEYGTWSPAVEEEAKQAGLVSLKDKYDFYMEKTKKNLSEHLDLYVSRVIEKTRAVLGDSLQSSFFRYLETLSALLILGVAGERVVRARHSARGWGPVVLFALFAVMMAGAVGYLPVAQPRWIYALAAMPLLRSLVRGDVLIMHGNLFFFSVLGCSAFGEYNQRFFLLFDFILAALYFAGLAMVVGAVGRVMLGSDHMPSRSPLFPTRGVDLILASAVAGILLLAVVGIPRSPVPTPPYVHWTDATAHLVSDAMYSKLPETLARKLEERLKTQGPLTSQSRAGDVLLLTGRLTGPAIFAPAHSKSECRFLMVQPRGYARTVVRAGGMLAGGAFRASEVIFPTWLSNKWLDRPVAMVAVDRGYDPDNFADYSEGLAIFPWSPDGKSIDFESGIIADDDGHLSIIESALDARSP